MGFRSFIAFASIVFYVVFSFFYYYRVSGVFDASLYINIIIDLFIINTYPKVSRYSNSLAVGSR